MGLHKSQDNLEAAVLALEENQNMYEALEMTLEASQEDYLMLVGKQEQHY